MFEKVSYKQFKEDTLKLFPDLQRHEDEIRAAYDSIKIPERKTAGSAGYDICTPFTYTLRQNSGAKTYTFPTGLRVILPPHTFLAIVPRSGSGFKTGVRLANTFGVIDEDYYKSPNEGHIMIKFVYGFSDFAMHRGDAVAQAIILPYQTFGEDVSTQRTGGFGSTGQ